MIRTSTILPWLDSLRNAAAQEIADGHVSVVVDRRDDRRDNLRTRGAEGDNGKADDGCRPRAENLGVMR